MLPSYVQTKESDGFYTHYNFYGIAKKSLSPKKGDRPALGGKTDLSKTLAQNRRNHTVGSERIIAEFSVGPFTWIVR